MGNGCGKLRQIRDLLVAASRERDAEVEAKKYAEKIKSTFFPMRHVDRLSFVSVFGSAHRSL